jgi:hypothetical protein
MIRCGSVKRILREEIAELEGSAAVKSPCEAASTSVFRTLVVVMLLCGATLARGSGLAAAGGTGGVSVQQSLDQVTLANGFVQLTFDRASHRIIHFSADHTREGRFKVELLAPEGITIGGDADATRAQVQLLQRRPQRVSLCLRWSTRSGAPIKLTLSLNAQARGVHVQAILPGGEGEQGVKVMLRQWFLLGIFERGAVQYVAGQRQYFSAASPLRLFYTMDRTNGSVALTPDADVPPAQVSLLSGANAEESGILLRPRDLVRDAGAWTQGVPQENTTGPAARSFEVGFTLYANDLPYPAHREDSRVDGMSDAQARDLTAYFEATYGSAAGVLGSYAEAGSAYPTLAVPGRAYGDSFDFFDPDSWETVTTLSYSGDPLLQREARKIIERSEAAQRSDGQIPHHFEHGAPTFLSIAGSSQTGPNIFWVLAATEYAAATGDEQWLRAHYIHLRMATDWLLARYDPKLQLVRADGPLFIDVFRRSGFTLDTNVFALYLLKRMNEVATFCGDFESEARYAQMRKHIRTGIQRWLWNGRDHFVTERHADGSTRDFVDYDGNFGALAFGAVADEADARRLLSRLDSGPHTHPGGYGTWVSERRYEKQDCYKENDGDSDTAMARIWWLDMAARVRMGDRATFDSLFEKMENYLLRNVWMPERFDAKGLPAHNGFYHEYPEALSMVLREMRYGVHVGMQEVTIRPFDVRTFSLHLGQLRVDYSTERVTILVPGTSARKVTIFELIPNAHYKVERGQSLKTDAHGTLHVSVSAGRLSTISLEK